MNKRIVFGGLKYRLRDNMFSLLITGGIYMAVMLLLLTLVISSDDGSSVSISGGEVAFAITLFIVGLIAVRADLRMFTLFGASRKTSFAANTVGTLVTALLAAPLCLAVLLLLQALYSLPGADSGSIVGIYSLVFPNGAAGSVAAALIELLLNFLLFSVCFAGGGLISLIYYRLNKLGKTLLSIVGGGLLLFGLPLGMAVPALAPLYSALARLFIAIFAFPGALALSLLLILVLTMLGNWLLLRRAPLR